MTDQPLICFHNLLSDAPYTVSAGTEYPGAPAGNMGNLDLLRPAQIEADASGVVQVDFTTPSAYGWGSVVYGLGPYGGTWRIDAIILGAHRHESGGYRTTGLTWEIAGYQVQDIWPENASILIKPATPIVPGSTITVRITGAAPGQLITIPELYVGPALAMPHLDLGYDPYHETTHAAVFRTESGREYLALRYRRLELRPRWSAITPDLWAMLDLLREDVLELRKPFWWAWAPDSRPHETYLVRHDGVAAQLPIRSAVHRTLDLRLVEAL